MSTVWQHHAKSAAADVDTRWTLDGHIDGHTQNAAKTEETYQLIENNKKNTCFLSFN